MPLIATLYENRSLIKPSVLESEILYCLSTFIQPSDVILVRSAAKVSKLISFATKGHFSHACVVISKTRAIEAIFDGVQISSLTRFAIENKKNIRVLRPNFETDEQRTSVQKYLEDFAYGHQGKGYNLVDAVKSVFGLRFKINEENLFCSQLVAMLFKQAGFSLFSKLEHNVNPNDYSRSDKLTDITSSAIIVIPDYITRRASVNGQEIRAIDDDSGASTCSLPAKLLREFVEESALIFQQYSLPKPNRTYDIIDQLTDPKNSDISLELDEKLSELYKSKNVNDALYGIFKKDTPRDIDFYKSEFRDYGADFSIEEYSFCLQVAPEYRKRVEEYTVYKNMFVKVHQKYGFEYALQQMAYYEIVINAAIFVLTEIGKQIQAYESLHGDRINV
jgi:hypothetical protein